MNIFKKIARHFDEKERKRRKEIEELDRIRIMLKVVDEALKDKTVTNISVTDLMKAIEEES